MPFQLRWSRLTDEQILKLRFCDLPLRLEKTPVYRRLQRLYGELQAKGLRFRPHVWLSTEFFTPDGVPGFAVPFYLAHPRLIRLEENQMLEAEGRTERECMRILRHEAGHALDNAFRLHQRSDWRNAFGNPTRPYPSSYKPNPASRKHVQHLNFWYAQAHPLEDFAETFAVWLRPGGRWQKTYDGWPAMRKIQYVAELMAQLKGRRQPNRTTARYEPLSKITMTLQEHYETKKQFYAPQWPDFYDRDLLRIFSREEDHGQASAVSFLWKYRKELCSAVAEGTGVPAYSIDHVLDGIRDRARELNLKIKGAEPNIKDQMMVLLTVHTMSMALSGRYRIRYAL